MYTSTVDPATLLTSGEKGALEAAAAVIANGGPLAPPEPLAEWERELVASTAVAVDPATAVEQARETIRTIKTRQAVRADTVELLRADPSGPLDLDAVQDVLMQGVRVREVGPERWVEHLLIVTGQQETGPLRRLHAGVQSVARRRDGGVAWQWQAETAGEFRTVEVSASSQAGVFSRRRWELHAVLAVAQDGYGELRVRPYGRTDIHTLTVSSGSADATTPYVGQVVGEMAVHWWMAYLARCGVREAVRA